jgi:hypothetical protein
MHRLTLPLTLLLASMAGMILTLLWAAQALPPQVASHFNAAGQPDDWMTRSAHLTLMTLIGLALPLGMLAIFWGVRYLPASIINLPHREYWLAPPRRSGAMETVFLFGLWFAVLQSLLFLGVHVLVIQANLAQPVQLSSLAWLLLVAFLLAVVVWLSLLWRRFRLPR